MSDRPSSANLLGRALGVLLKERGPGPFRNGRFDRYLSVPTTPGFRVAGWIVASAIFATSLIVWYGMDHGPSGPITPTGDSWESSTPAIAVEHGVFRCAYPASARSSVPPLYPTIAGGILAATGSLFRIGPWVHASACPALGQRANGTAYPEWSFLLTGLVAWPALLAGFVALLSVSGRGGTRFELLGTWTLGAIPAIASAYMQYFHPEDLLAMGMALMAIALAVRRRWVAAGVCLGLACCAKQYAVLAAIPLILGAPRGARARLTAAAAGTGALVLAPLAVVMGKGMLLSLAGRYATTMNGQTLVGQLGMHGDLRLALARGLPLAIAAGLAVLARARLGDDLLDPVPLTALVAGSLILRLVFEVNLYSYYFLAAAVSLVALEVVGGRFRLGTVTWLVVTGALYPPAYEVLVPIQERAALFVQAGVVLSALALALGPLLRPAPAGSLVPASVAAPSTPSLRVPARSAAG